MTIQTTMFEKWKKFQKSSIRDRDCFQTASILCLCFLSSIFSWVNTKILIKASPSCLDPCSFHLITHTAHPVLSIQQKQSLRWSSSPYSLFTQSNHFGGSRKLLQKCKPKVHIQCSYCLKAFSPWACAADSPCSPSLKCTGCGHEVLSTTCFTLSVCSYCSKVLCHRDVSYILSNVINLISLYFIFTLLPRP